MTTAIVWFKTDLRLHDNETLIKTIENSDRIIPVYCLDDRHYSISPFGFRKTGSFRAQFILQALQDLDSSLRQRGSGLLVVRGNPAIELSRLVQQYDVATIYTSEEIAHEELLTQREVEDAAGSLGCALKTLSTAALYQHADLPFPINAIPDVFTAFRHKVEAAVHVRPTFHAPSAISSPAIPPLQLPSLPQLNLSPVQPDARAAFNFYGGESAALRRVHYYFEQTKLVATYKHTRNQLVGPDYSTKCSAWLACGSLSARYVYHMLKDYEHKYGANDSTYWVIFELLWRDYFRLMMMKYGNRFFLKGGIKGGANQRGIHDKSALLKWIEGNTGVDFVDANMRELKATGFMSNRGRQNVASFLCNDLKLDWRYGAAYFEEQLVDYDVCSNWANWPYIAGVGNDPRPNRYFNIQKQADQYDADRKYRDLWNDSV